MNTTHLVYGLLAVVAGALIPLMASLNGSLGALIGSSHYAALVLLGVGFVTVLAVILVSGSPLPATLAMTSWHHYAAGLIVAFYILAITYVAPRFGLGNAIFCVVAAQIVSATLIDHVGLFGAEVRHVDTRRAMGIVLLIGGIFLAHTPPPSS